LDSNPPNPRHDAVKQGRKISRVHQFIIEAKRRKVFQVTSVYLVAAWGLSAGAAEIFPALGLPAWTVRYLVIGLFSATPVVIVIAWIYEFSDQGIQRDRDLHKLTEQETVIAHAGDVPVLTARWQGQELRFGFDFYIGRDESCEMQLVDPMISRRHARVEYQGGAWFLRDLGSANGTEVNGKKVESVRLQAGAVVGFYAGGPLLTIDIAPSDSAQTTILSGP